MGNTGEVPAGQGPRAPPHSAPSAEGEASRGLWPGRQDCRGPQREAWDRGFPAPPPPPGTSHKGRSGPQFQKRTSDGFKPELPRQPSASTPPPWEPQMAATSGRAGDSGVPALPRRPMGPLAISRGWQVPPRGAGCWESGPPPLEVSAVARGSREGTLVVLPTHTRGEAEPPSLACPHQTWNPGRRGLRSRNPGLAGGQPHLGGVGPASQTVSQARWKGLGSSGSFRGTCRGAGARSHMHVTSHRVGGLLPSRGFGQVLVWPGGFLGWGGLLPLGCGAPGLCLGVSVCCGLGKAPLPAPGWWEEEARDRGCAARPSDPHRGGSSGSTLWSVGRLGLGRPEDRGWGPRVTRHGLCR